MRSRRDDAGSGLVEVVVAMAVTTVLFGVFMTMVVVMARATRTVSSSATASTQLRTAVDTMGRQLASGSAVNAPTTVGTDVYLEVRTDAVSAGKAATCTQWRLRTTTRQLQSRSWDLLTATPTAWRTLVSDVGNVPATRPPFTVQSADALHTRPVVTVDLLVAPTGQPDVSTSAAYALRNYDPTATTVCTEVARA